MARFAPPIHLVFWRAGAVLAVPFEPKRRRVGGEPSVLAEKTGGDPSSGVAYAALAADGTLAYVTGGASLSERRLMLTDRAGKARPVPVPLRSYLIRAFRRTEAHCGDDRTRPWQRRRHLDLRTATGALSRLTFGDGNGNDYPVWSSDKGSVAFSSDRGHQGV